MTRDEAARHRLAAADRQRSIWRAQTDADWCRAVLCRGARARNATLTFYIEVHL